MTVKKLTAERKKRGKKELQQKFYDRGNIIKTDRDTELVPRCIFDDQEITLSSEGYFTPCCWLDDELYRSQPYVNNFFQPHLNIENHENIQDIFDSKVWKRFWNILLQRPDKAPPVCWEYCANPKGDSETIETGMNYKVVKRH